MRARLTIVLAVLVSCLVAAGPADARHRPSCRHGGHTVKKNRLVRLYTREIEDGRALVACDRKTRRRTVVASDFDDGYVTSEHYDLLRLRKRFVALHDVYTDISCKADCPPGYEPTSSDIYVVNARTQIRRVIKATPDQLVLAVNGGVAWAERAGSVEEIRAGDSDGSLRTLDSGDIDPSTLRIELTIASWIKGGTEYFARLH